MTHSLCLLSSSLSLCVPFLSPSRRLSLALIPDLPPSPAAAHWAVQYITIKAASLSLSLGGAPEVVGPAAPGSNRGHGPISAQRCPALSVITGLFSRHETANTGSLKTLVCSPPSTFPNLCCLVSLCAFQSRPPPPRSMTDQRRARLEPAAAHSGRRKKKKKREGGKQMLVTVWGQ